MVGSILCIGYILFPSIDDKLIFITSVIGGSCALYSAFYVGRTLRLQYRMTLMHNSFELLSNVHSLELMKVRSELDRKFNHRNVMPSEFYDKIQSDPVFDVTVRSLFNLYEGISIAIQNDYVDERLIYDDLGFIIPHSYENFLPYIQEVRKRYNPLVYIEIEKLVYSWGQKKYLSTNKAIRQSKPKGTDQGE